MGAGRLHAGRMGGLRRATDADIAEHGAVLAAGHHVRRRRRDDLRRARHAGPRVAARRTGCRAVGPVLGEVGGEETHTLTVADIPSHDHGVSSHTHSVPALAVDVKASSADATSSTAQGNVLATAAAAVGGNDHEKGKHKGADKDVDMATNIYNAGPASVSLAAGSAMTLPGTTGGGSGTTMATGGGGAHQNMPPYLAVRCIIATQGIFPTRQ